MTLDVARIRKDFPILDRQVRDGQPLVYLDSANTSQKPRQVIERLDEFYERHNANIHRASHQLGEEATAAYEGARIKAAGFIGARDETEVVFTKNISEGINLVAYALGNATAGQSGRLRAVPPQPRRRDRHHRDGAPLQHRPVAAALRAHRSHAALVRGDRRRPARPVPGRPAHQRADQAGGPGPPVQRPRHHQPGPRDRRRRARGRGPGAGGRGPVGPAHAGGRAGAGGRLPGLHQPQDVRPDRHRRAVGPPRAARGDAPVPGRRRDDRERLDGPLDVRAPAAQVRGRDHAHRRGGRAGRGHRLPHRRGPGRDPGARAGSDRLRAGRPGYRAGPAGARPRGSGHPRRGDLVHPGGRAPARREPGARRARRGRPRRAPLRVAAAPPVRHPGQHPGLVLPVQHDRRGGRPGRGNPAGSAVLRGA